MHTNLLYATKDEETVTFYQEIMDNHYIKIIKKKNIITIEPQYQNLLKENKNEEQRQYR